MSAEVDERTKVDERDELHEKAEVPDRADLMKALSSISLMRELSFI